MPNYLFKSVLTVLAVLSLCLSMEAWADPTYSPAEPNPSFSTLVQSTNRGLDQISTDELKLIASFLSADPLSRLSRTKKNFVPLFKNFLLNSANEAQLKAKFISTLKQLQIRVYPEIAENQSMPLSYQLKDLEKLNQFKPEFFSFSQLYVFTKLYHYLAFGPSPLVESDPLLNKFYKLSQTTYLDYPGKIDWENLLRTPDELFPYFLGINFGSMTGALLGEHFAPSHTVLLSTIGTAIGGLCSSQKIRHVFFRTSIPRDALKYSLKMISTYLLVIYDHICPLNRDTYLGSTVERNEADTIRDQEELRQMVPNIGKTPVVYSILDPFIFKGRPTPNEQIRIIRDIQFLNSIPQMKEILDFAGASEWAHQEITSE